MLPFRLDKLFEIEMELSVKAVSECEPVTSQSCVITHQKHRGRRIARVSLIG